MIDKKIPNILKQNVSYRFPKVKETKDIGIYYLNNIDKYIILKAKEVQELKEYSEVLTQLLNYKWAMLLEKYNIAPKISNKVEGSGAENIKRKSLTHFKNLLILQYHENPIRDFYSGEIIQGQDISIDHVIPWSYIYDDDIWNLVITTKSFNSSKSNQIIKNDLYIKKLENRNKKLVDVLKENGSSKKYVNDLIYANENNVVREFYNYFKG